MKAFVAIKRVIDYAVKPRLAADKKWMDTEGSVKHSMNPFDEIAVEAALRLKSSSIVDHITAISCGPSKCQDVLRSALALGVDEAVHVEIPDGDILAKGGTSSVGYLEKSKMFINFSCSPLGNLQPLAVAKILSTLAKRDKPDLFLLGKQAIDDDSNQTGQLLAGILDWPQVRLFFNLFIRMTDCKK